MKLFVKIANVFEKSSTLDVWLDSEYTYDNHML